jgi:hypothetical protein
MIRIDVILKKLQKDNNIVILKSDKGNSLVVQDIDKYFLYGHEFFGGDDFIRSGNDNEVKFNQLDLYLQKLFKAKKIDENFLNNSKPKTFRTPVAHFLPKTHKPDFLQNLKYRPIISSYNSYCSNLSKELSRLLSREVYQSKKELSNFCKIYEILKFLRELNLSALMLRVCFLLSPSIKLSIWLQSYC